VCHLYDNNNKWRLSVQLQLQLVNSQLLSSTRVVKNVFDPHFRIPHTARSNHLIYLIFCVSMTKWLENKHSKFQWNLLKNDGYRAVKLGSVFVFFITWCAIEWAPHSPDLNPPDFFSVGSFEGKSLWKQSPNSPGTENINRQANPKNHQRTDQKRDWPLRQTRQNLPPEGRGSFGACSLSCSKNNEKIYTITWNFVQTSCKALI